MIREGEDKKRNTSHAKQFIEKVGCDLEKVTCRKQSNEEH